MGDGVVTAFYQALTTSPAAFCFLAEGSSRVEGFAAGVSDWSRFFRDFVRRAWWPLLWTLPSLFARKRWRRLMETGRYTQSGHEGVRAEFLSLGVHPEATGRLWIGTALVRAVVNEFRRRGVSRIRGVVWEENERALRFFKGVGFRFVSEVEIHPGEVSRTFVVDVIPGSEGA